MWSLILGFLGGPLLNNLVAAYRAKLDATNTAEGHAIDLAKAELLAEIEARKDAQTIIIAEQGRWWTALPRPAFAYIFVGYVGKCVVWDNMLGMGSTDPLSPELASIMTVVITAYFGGRSLEKIATTVAGVFKR